MKKKPLVSIIIRTKNEQRYIGIVLDYLRQQTFQDFEIVIIDSGSTDKTLSIIKNYPIKLMKIKAKDYNPSYALNLAINKAKGKIMCIISAHSIPITDTWLEDGLENFKDKSVVGVAGNYSTIPIGYWNRKLGRIFFNAHHWKRMEYYNHISNTNSLIKKSLWKKYPFDEKMNGSEDKDWSYEMLARGHNIIKDPKFNVFHSHIFLPERPSNRSRLGRWIRNDWIIKARKRPRKSFAKVKID